MSARTRSLARSGIFAALAAALIWLSAVLPSGKLAVLALCSLVSAAAVIHCGWKWSLGVFSAAGVLGLILSPIKGCAVLYFLFFGWYPIAKSPLEHIRSLPLCWGAKLLVFNAALIAVWLLARELVFTQITLPEIGPALLWLLANGVFLLYDFCLTQLISRYLTQISKHYR